MKLTILGSSASYPNAGCATAGYILETEHDKLLIDCGHGVAGIVQEVVNLKDLTGVIISHMHPDHFYDLIALRNNFYNFKLPSIPLYLPSEGATIMADIIAATRFPVTYMTEYFEIHEYDEKSTIAFKDIDIITSKNIHPVNAYAMRFTEKNNPKVFVYTSDTAMYETLPSFCKNAELLMIECVDYPAYKIGDKRWHVGPNEIIDLLNETNPKKCVITHYENKYTDEISEILKSEVTSKTELFFANELDTFTI